MRTKPDRHFTAIELILVCAIVAILFTIAMPAFSGLITGNLITRGGNQVASKLSLARAKAVAMRRYVGLVFDEESYRMAKFKKGKSQTLVFDGWMDGEGREFLPSGLILPGDSANRTTNFCCGKPVVTTMEVDVEISEEEAKDNPDAKKDGDKYIIPKGTEIENGTAMPAATGVPADISEGSGATRTTTRAVGFRPSGAVFMQVGKETNCVSLRFAEGYKTPGSEKYDLRKNANGIILYANLLISAMSGQPTIEYVQSLK